MDKHEIRKFSHDIADYAGIKKHEIMVHSSKIPINLYEGEIMVMWKDMPRKLDEFSPIHTDKSTINKFYVFGPEDTSVRQKIREYMKQKFGTKLD